MASPMDDSLTPGEEHSNNSCVIPGYSDVNEFSQKALKSVLKATRSSNDLPVGDDFDFYSTYRSVRDVLDIEGQRILSLLKQLLRSQNVKGNVSHGDTVEIDDQFDVLMDANDQILERAGTLLDEASGLRKEETKLVIASLSAKQPKATTSWNKKAAASTGKSPVSYSLMTARNIQRPQMRFRDKIDNSNLPFKPQLRRKPNPLKSLEESLKLPEGVQPEDAEKPNFNYPNPYLLEINGFTPSQECLQRVTPQEPKPLTLTPLMIVSTEKQLRDMMDDLKRQTEIAVDLEHHSYRSFQGITCLLQISTRTHDYIVDTLELRSHLDILNEVFTHPNIVKVLHGADSDIGWLQRDFGVYIVNMFDTGQAARVLGLSRFSLAHLLMNYCQVEADKQFQLADWRIRPLPQELINYAREDTHFLLYIYDVMRNQLLDRGNTTGNLLISVYERSKAVAARVFQKPIFTAEDYLELYKKSKKVFNNQQMAALKNLYAWRDGMARLEDESLGYILPNHMLLQIAEILPRERQGVLACCNPIPPLVRQNLMEIHAMVLQAREVALIKVEKRPVVQPSNLQHPKYNVDSLLNCQHDMSHLDVQTIKSEEIFLDSSLVSERGMLFAGRAAEVMLKVTPSVKAYGWDNKQTVCAASEKADVVKACFSNPFAKFLPKAMRGDKFMLESTDIWRMKASNVKPSAPVDHKKRKVTESSVDLDNFEPEYVPQSKRSKVTGSDASSSSSSNTSVFKVPSVPSSASTAAATTTASGPAKSLFSVPENATSNNVLQSVERRIKSLREEVNIKKKKKKKALKEREKKRKETEHAERAETTSVSQSHQLSSDKDSNQSASSSASSSSQSSMSTTASVTTVGSTDTSAAGQTPLPSKKEKKKAKKAKKLTLAEVEENFTAFDYSAAEKTMEKKKKNKKKQDIFNPALPSRMGKDKNKAKKPKLSGANSNKLISFGPSMPGQGGKKKN